MPILTSKSSAPTNKVETTPNALPPTYHSETVDSRYVPAASLLTHIEGSSWSVTFFSQVVDVDTELQPQQLSLQAAYQQYIRINRLELKVSSDLQTSQNEETKAMEVVGSATMYPFVVPNKGDMFIADIGDGRQGIFTITRSERKTILKETCYLVDYLLVSYDNKERLDDLEQKTIKTTHFVKEFLQHGQNPVIVDSEFNAVVELKRGYKRLLAHYFADFYSLEYGTLLVPDQKEVTYDPFLTKAVVSVLDTTENPIVKKIKTLNVDYDQAMKMINIWNCLLTMSGDLLVLAGQKYGLTSVENFDIDARYEGIRYSGVRNVVYPLDERTDVDADYCEPHDLVTSLIVQGKTRTSEVRRLVFEPSLDGFHSEGQTEVEGLDALPTIHKVTKDNYYVFSEALYFEDPINRSQLEVLVQDALYHKPINLLVLKRLVDEAKRWGNLERFYYIPVLIMLIKTALRGF